MNIVNLLHFNVNMIKEKDGIEHEKEIDKNTLQQIIDYVWELESDCITMELGSANYDERCMYSKSAEVLTKVRNYVEELI